MSDNQQDLLSSLKKTLLALRKVKARADALEAERSEPIALIGMACRFPGGASSPSAYWALLRDGVDAVIEVPRERWDASAYYDPDPQSPSTMYTRSGGFIGDPGLFDADFFGISPREAKRLDPQQRLLLEVGWEALENAGIVPESLAGTRAGVFMGISACDYRALQMRDGMLESVDMYAGTGTSTSFAAGRLSYVLGLQGPSLSVDTACSSSLVAVHLACQSLRAGECSMALAGGVHLMLTPEGHIYLSQARALAPDGRSKTFSAEADGYGRGEGCGVVVLKRLSQAQADGDRILAVIRGSAVIHDGASSGLTVPNGMAQQAAVREALASARLTPADVDYVEAHGTGTKLGDPIEVDALAAVHGAGHSPERPLRVGSVKTNIGHLEAAAGVAGLMKVVLALQHERLPAHLHLRELNPHIPWAQMPVAVTKEASPWPRNGKRRVAGVSSFGLSGTNAHLIVEEASPPEAAQAVSGRGGAEDDAEQATVEPRAAQQPASEARPPIGWVALPLSAKSDAALQALAAAYSAYLADEQSEGDLADIAYTASCRRSHHAHRLAVVGDSRAALAEALSAFASGARHPRLVTERGRGAGKVVFVFPGQGSQWSGMGRELLEREAVFRQSVEACDKAFAAHVDWSVQGVLRGEGDPGALERVDVVQPTLFAMAVGLSALWRSWGVEPDAVVGHSQGEIAAAYVAGALSLEDAAAVVCQRSRLLVEVSGQGAMAMVELSAEQVSERLRGLEGEVSVAASNGPRATVIAGHPAEVDKALEKLSGEGVFCRRVKVDVASHSAQMDVLKPALSQALEGVRGRAGRVPIYSTVTGEVSDGSGFDGGYWVRNLRERVQFGRAVERLVEDGHRLFIELSPHPILTQATASIVETAEISGLAIPSLRRDGGVLGTERAALLHSLSILYTSGHAVDWRRQHPAGGQVVHLPTYAFQRERYWVDPIEGGSPALSAQASRIGHGSSLAQAPASDDPDAPAYPLAGQRLLLPSDSIHHVLPISVRDQPYLADHVVYGVVVVPGAFYLAALLAVAEARLESGSFTLRDVQFVQPLLLTADTELHLVLTPDGDGRYAVQISTPDPSNPGTWRHHAAGVLERGAQSSAEPWRSLSDIRARCPKDHQVDGVFARLAELSIMWGPKWQWMQGLHSGDREALAFLNPVAQGRMAAPLHPTLIDNSFGSGMAFWPARAASGEETPHLPFFVEALRYYAPARGAVYCYARLREAISDSGETTVHDLVLMDELGRVVAEIDGFTAKHAPRSAFLRMGAFAPEESLYELAWSPAEPAEPQAKAPAPAGGAREKRRAGRWVVVSADESDGARLCAALEQQGEAWIHGTLGPARATAEGRVVALDPRRAADFAELIASARSERIAGVVCLWTRKEPEAERLPEVAEELSVAGLHLMQALLAGDGAAAPVWWVTRGAQAASAGAAVAVAQAPLWGLGRVTLREHPELGCTLVDLDPAAPPDQALEALLRELSLADGEEQVAVRDGVRLLPRLLRSRLAAEEASATLEQDGSYLITGGLGALGLHVARWLVEEKGARHLILVGRRAPSAEQQVEIDRLAAAGAVITAAQADVTDIAQVRELFRRLSRVDGGPGEAAATPRLRGVIHTAGVLDDGVLTSQDAARFAAVMAPKVAGAWNLHRETAGMDLDWFVLFSSASSLMGGAGQANYASANAFMDGLAHLRRAEGLPATVINWGLWSGGGMGDALDAAGRKRFDRTGFRPIAPEQGVALLDRALAIGAAQLCALRLDRRVLRDAFVGERVPTVLRELVSARGRGAKRSPTEALVDRLRAVTHAERSAVLHTAVQGEVARVLGLGSARDVPLGRPVQMLGLDSLMALELRNAISALVGKPVPPTLVFDYPTVEAMTRYLLTGVLALEERVAAVQSPAAEAPASSEPIAIVGIGCRYPGGVTDPASFWALQRDGRSAIREVPPERWSVDALYDPNPDARGKMATRHGGFLDGVDMFEPEFFGISPREAPSIDPQHRLLLEVSWEALEHAAIPPESLSGTQTGVFLGIMAHDYECLYTGALDRLDGTLLTGVASSVASGRISYLLGLQGPSISVDTACSSSLVALHLACQSLRSGECDVALTGGASLMLSPAVMVEFSRLHGIAPDGRTKTFSASADGVVCSEGCGILVLKRLSKAEADGDRILGVIRGTAVNQDGRSHGLTAPNGPAQRAVIRRALQQAGVGPADIDFVETHGTGTALGDAIEVQAVGEVLGEGRAAERPVVLGALKTNIGHTQAAAGVAGVIKAVLALEHQMIPPNLHFDEPSNLVSWSDLKVKVASAPVPWKAAQGAPRRAGVSAFSLSGTNAHVIVEEPPPVTRPRREREALRPVLLPLSARDDVALRALAERMERWLGASGGVADIHDVAFTAACRRSHHPHRLAVVGATAEELRARLEAFAAGATEGLMASGQGAAFGKVVFVFSGAEGAFAGLASDLLDEPAFGEAIAACEAALSLHLDRPLRALIAAAPPAGAPWLSAEERDPVLFAIAVALARLWQAWGVTPSAVLGAGVGEVAAAHVAGALTLEDAARIVCLRSRPGDALRTAPGIQPRAAEVRWISTVTGEVVEGREADAAYWARQQAPAQVDKAIDKAVERLLAEEHTLFVEVGGAPHLAAALEARRAGAGVAFAVVRCAAPGQLGLASMLASLGCLYAEGYPVDWQRQHPDAGEVVSLPTYPFHRARYWLKDAPAGAGRAALPRATAAAGHPLLGPSFTMSVHPGTRYWERAVSGADLSYLAAAEAPAGEVQVPAAALLEALLSAASAARDRLHEAACVLEDVRLLEPLRLPAHGARTLQLALTEDGPSRQSLRVSSLEAAAGPGAGGEAGAWQVHVTAQLRLHAEAAEVAMPNLAQLQAQCPQAWPDLPAASASHPGLAAFEALTTGPGEALARLSLPEEAERHRVDAILLDACAQALAAAATGSDPAAWAPPHVVGARSVTLRAPRPAGPLWCHARIESQSPGAEGAEIEGSARLLDADGQVYAALTGLRLRRPEAARRAGRTSELDLMWTVTFRAGELLPEPGVGAGAGRWLLLAAGDGVAAEALRSRLQAAGADAELAVLVGARGAPPGVSAVDPRSSTAMAKLVGEWLAAGPSRGVVFMSAEPESGGGSGPTPGEGGRIWGGLLHLVQALSRAIGERGLRNPPRLAIVTGGAQPVGATPIAPAQSALWGLGATVAAEHPQLRCARIDLGDGTPEEIAALARELLADGPEDRCALRGAARYLARLVRQAPPGAVDEVLEPAGDRGYRLEVDEPGVLDRVTLRARPRRSPGPGEVEIAVEAAGVNFLDVLTALGLIPRFNDPAGQPLELGGECAGRVVAVGAGVDHLRPGDTVVAVCSGGFSAYVVASAALVRPLPRGLTPSEAATLPIAHLTAYYALTRVARLAPGERVLIHAAAGGVGQAAIQWARHVGATIFATAGTEEKRAYLREQGISYVSDSRSLRFVDDILAWTHGEGVDVVLNSLAGAFIPKSFGLLRDHGRFVEIGKRDYLADASLGLRPFLKNLSFSLVDLLSMVTRRKDEVSALFTEVLAHVERGALGPLPHRSFPIGEIASVFRDMAQGEHRGKLVALVGDPTVPVAVPVNEVRRARADGAYLITGGLGKLGLTAAEWLVEQGARHLVLVDRARPEDEQARAAVTSLEAAGAEVSVLHLDLENADRIAEALGHLEAAGRPLRGVIHAALEDAGAGLLSSQSLADLERTLEPRLASACALDVVTRGAPLDFFVLCTSAAPLVGGPELGVQAAYNAFLAGLAHRRRAEGLPALTIAWGPLMEGELPGLHALTQAEAKALLTRLLGSGQVEVGAARFDVRQWRDVYPHMANSPWLSELSGEAESGLPAGADDALLSSIRAAQPGARRRALEDFLRAQVAEVLRLDRTRIGRGAPLTSLGMSSLMGIELRNRLERALGLPLPATLLWALPTIADLSDDLLGRLALDDAEAPAKEPERPAPEVGVDIASIAGLSQAETDALIAAELAGFEEMLGGADT